MKKYVAILFLFPLLPFLSISQSIGTCGTSIPDLQINAKKILQQRAKGNVADFRAVVFIPIWFHIVSRTDGSSAVGEGSILDMLCDMNKIYAANGMDMQFYLKGFNYIKSDELYNGTQSDAAYNIMKTNKKSDGINVFINNNAGINLTQGVLAYYSNVQNSTDAPYANDWIVLVKTQVGGGTKAATLGHEIGHLFSLIHTFHGWESAPFKPTSTAPCAPAVSPDGFTPTEKHSRGSDGNCANAGDYMCDTPEDYNFGFGWNGCSYTGIAKDPTCITATPSEINIMGYFIGCLAQFSAQQKQAVRNNYANDLGRAYLRNGNISPSLTEIGTTALISPANAATTSSYNNINLSWANTVGAVSYVVEISPNSSFDVDPVRFISSGTILNLNSKILPVNYLKPGTLYFWRVRGFSAYKTCATFTKSFFTTGTLNAAQEINTISDFTVSPNPVSGDADFITVGIISQNNLSGHLKIINLNGQILYSEPHLFAAGLTNENVSVNNLPKGMYILLIESGEGIVHRKFIKQ